MGRGFIGLHFLLGRELLVRGAEHRPLPAARARAQYLARAGGPHRVLAIDVTELVGQERLQRARRELRESRRRDAHREVTRRVWQPDHPDAPCDLAVRVTASTLA